MSVNATKVKPSAAPVTTGVQGAKSTQEDPLKALYLRTNAGKKWTFSSKLKNLVTPGRKEAKEAQARIANVRAAVAMHPGVDTLVNSPMRVSSMAPKYWLSEMKSASAGVVSDVVEAGLAAGEGKDLYSMFNKPQENAKELDAIATQAFEAMIPPEGTAAEAAAAFSTAVVERAAELLNGVCSSELFSALNPLEKSRVLDSLITYAFFQGPGRPIDSDLAASVIARQHEGATDDAFKRDFTEHNMRVMLGKALPNLLGTASDTKLKDGEKTIKFSSDMQSRGKAFFAALQARIYSKVDFTAPKPVSLEKPKLQKFVGNLVNTALEDAGNGKASGELSDSSQVYLRQMKGVIDSGICKTNGYKVPSEFKLVESGAMDSVVRKLAAKVLPDDVNVKDSVEWKFVVDTNTGDVKATYALEDQTSDLKVFAGTIVFSQDGSWHIQDPVTHV